MKNYGANKHPAKNFSNAGFISVNCVGLTLSLFFPAGGIQTLFSAIINQGFMYALTISG